MVLSLNLPVDLRGCAECQHDLQGAYIHAMRRAVDRQRLISYDHRVQLVLLGQDISLMAAVAIYGVAVLVGAVSFLPGGLGSTEAVMGLLLISLGVPEPVAVAATLICRIATLWFAVFIGLITAAVLAGKGITPIAQQDGV